MSEATLVGYARVSTLEQDPALQLDALAEVGCARVFVERASGARADRPELAAAVDWCRPGDVLVVWRLDRLGRSLRDLVNQVARLEDAGVGLRSLREAIDTTTSGGRLQLHLFAALAEFERDLIRERTLAGLAAARARGRKPGRRTVMTPEKVTAARNLLADPEVSVSAVAAALEVSRATLYRHMSIAQDEVGTTERKVQA